MKTKHEAKAGTKTKIQGPYSFCISALVETTIAFLSGREGFVPEAVQGGRLFPHLGAEHEIKLIVDAIADQGNMKRSLAWGRVQAQASKVLSGRFVDYNPKTGTSRVAEVAAVRVR
jgi:hypothetical protein